MLEETGFENIDENICVWPIGTWSEKKRKKKLGAELREYWLATFEAFAWRQFREMNWQREETQILLANARTEIDSEKIRASMRIRTFCAGKPYLD